MARHDQAVGQTGFDEGASLWPRKAERTDTQTEVEAGEVGESCYARSVRSNASATSIQDWRLMALTSGSFSMSTSVLSTSSSSMGRAELADSYQRSQRSRFRDPQLCSLGFIGSIVENLTRVER
jgi:hypothetical protein